MLGSQPTCPASRTCHQLLTVRAALAGVRRGSAPPAPGRAGAPHAAPLLPAQDTAAPLQPPPAAPALAFSTPDMLPQTEQALTSLASPLEQAPALVAEPLPKHEIEPEQDTGGDDGDSDSGDTASAADSDDFAYYAARTAC